MLTTTEAAALYTKERGVPIQPVTVKRWCQNGWISGATYGVVVGADRKPRAQWLIPPDALLAFTPPKRGWQRGRKRKDQSSSSA